MEHIGSRIKLLREELGLTQADLFRSTGIKQTTLSSIESGTEPKAGIVSLIVAAYPHVNPDWLLNGSGSMLRDGRSLTPLEAPATKAAPTVLAPVGQQAATPPAGGADSELVKEIRESRDRAWRVAEKEQKNAEYWRALYLAEVKRYLPFEEPHEDAPETPAESAAPGKSEVDDFAADLNPSTGIPYIGHVKRDGNGIIKVNKVFMATEHTVLTEDGRMIFTCNPAKDLDLIINETPEEELDEYLLVKTA